MIICFVASGSNAAFAEHPTIYIDKGACPFECCIYGQWQVTRDTVLYDTPDKKAKIIGKCRSGSSVTAVTGEVHTVAGKFNVKKEFESFKPGDVLWIYTYLGEGYFKVWDAEHFKELSLGFSPYGGSAGKRCEADNLCVGELEEELDTTWWIKIKTVDGLIGWTFEATNFIGKDSCD